MKTLEPVTSANFDEKVLKSKQPFLVEFGAVWCGPCKRLEPELAKLQTRMGGKVIFGKIDVDEASDLALRFMVFTLPTVLLFVDGQLRQRVSGFQPIQRLLEQFELNVFVGVEAALS